MRASLGRSVRTDSMIAHQPALVALSLALAACAVNPTSTDTDGASSGATDTGAVDDAPLPQTTATSVSTTAVADSGDTTGAGTTTADDAGTDTGAGFINMPTGDAPPPQAVGAECFANEDCESLFCYEFFNGGVCSECLGDADCEQGGCSFEFGIGYAACNAGAIGDGCETDAACTDPLVCASPIAGDLPISFAACSECGPDLPCTDPAICAPFLDDGLGSSYLSCVDPGAVALGGGCPLLGPGQGDGTACASGFCAIASVFMGNAELGLCSECVVDTDCLVQGQVCAPPELMMGGVVSPGACM